MSTSQGPTLLIVDNDDGLRAALAARLAAHGYRCITACSGAQALSLFQEQEVQFVITDLNMPAGDGVALATEIRRRSDVPIMFITGFRDAFKRVMRSVKDVLILQKPFDPQELVSLIETTLAIRLLR
jgi:DNA-binding response OmpR family regulator